MNGEPTKLYGDLIRVSPMRYVVPSRLDVNYIKYKMPIYEDDLWIVTPPKCGTTWTQEIVWLLLNNVDLEAAKINQFYRIPFLELDSIRGPSSEPYQKDLEMNEENLHHFESNSFEFAQSRPRPRVIKTHLPLTMLPNKLLDTCKVIFVARNVKDMAVSYYYHHKLIIPVDFPFKEFATVFKNGAILQTPMIPMVLEAWEKRHHPNMCFNTFEEMKADIDGVVGKLCKFLGLKLSDENKAKLLKAVSFDSLKKNKFVNKQKEFDQQDPAKEKVFIRKGMIGDWKNHFDEEMNAEWDPWIQNQLTNTDYSMIFE